MAKQVFNTVPFRSFALCFLSTRVLEAIWIVVAVAVALVLEHTSDSAVADPWKYWTGSNTAYAGLVVIVWYYLGFAYILISGAVLFSAWRYWKVRSARRYGTLNVVVFCVHSIAVIVLVFHGTLSPAIWWVWVSTVLYNVVVPSSLWRLLVSNSPNITQLDP